MFQMDPTDNSRRPLPRSLEDLKRQRQFTLECESRPMFVPKKLRQTLLESDNAETKTTESSSRTDDMSDSSRTHYRSRRNETTFIESKSASTMHELEADAIRRHYMGAGLPNAKKQIHGRQNEKTRFRFEWDASEDTNAHEMDPDLEQLRKNMAAERMHPSRSGSTRDTDFQLGRGSGVKMRNSRYNRDCMRFSNNIHDDRHWSEKSREEMTDRDWSIFKEDQAITIRGSTTMPIRPARNWEETELTPDILSLIRDVSQYRKPSAIQMAAIPVGVSRRDLIGLAETGSGKTAAFTLPLLMHIKELPAMTKQIASDGPYALVLAPTRELVLQIESETKKFAVPLGFRVVAVIGGQGLEEQGLALQAGCEIVICTPGRMVDLLSRRLAALGNCRHLILDEADRMIDMGFEPQVQEILSAMPEPPVETKTVDSSSTRTPSRLQNPRQTSMFSATMSPSIERLARQYLFQPITISVGAIGKAADMVEQKVEVLSSEGQKRVRLLELLRYLEPPIVVFGNTKKGCEDISRTIESGTGIRPVVLHSGKSQEQREEVLDGFRKGRYDVLVATDVLGRGIDIKGVNHIINFELPKNIDTYTHRIGRTGRAGRKGTAWSLATSADSDMFGELRNYLQQSGAPICPALARFEGTKSSGLRPIID